MSNGDDGLYPMDSPIGEGSVRWEEPPEVYRHDTYPEDDDRGSKHRVKVKGRYRGMGFLWHI